MVAAIAAPARKRRAEPSPRLRVKTFWFCSDTDKRGSFRFQPRTTHYEFLIVKKISTWRTNFGAVLVGSFSLFQSERVDLREKFAACDRSGEVHHKKSERRSARFRFKP